MTAKTILYDLDGTLTDSRRGITSTICRVLSDFGKTGVEPESLTWCIGPPLRDSLAKLLEDEGPLADEALARYEEYYRGGGMFVNRVYDGVMESLEKLRKAGFHLSVVSGKPIDQSQPILDHFGLAPFFSGVFGPTPENRSEDKTLLLGNALLSLERKGADCIYVGDRQVDAIGAQNNDIGFLGVDYGYGDRDELQAAGARVIVSSPRDWLQGIIALSNQREED